jgi:NADH dehydrogenase FAD-containing subunit
MVTSADIIQTARVPNTNSVFFLGCFENRVTLYSQQVRALNLVDAILDQQLVREHGKVAIVGGGAAGITAAAALAKTAPALQKIDLFEARSDILEFQHRSSRCLHPHIYDWPGPGTDRLDAGLLS